MWAWSFLKVIYKTRVSDTGMYMHEKTSREDLIVQIGDKEERDQLFALAIKIASVWAQQGKFRLTIKQQFVIHPNSFLKITSIISHFPSGDLFFFLTVICQVLILCQSFKVILEIIRAA